MKRSFALLVTTLLVAIFSLLLVQLYFTQNITMTQKNREYLHTQSSYYLKLFKAIILDSKSQICLEKLTLDNIDSFDIYAQVDCFKHPAVVDAFVEYKGDDFSIKLHNRFLKSYKP